MYAQMKRSSEEAPSASVAKGTRKRPRTDSSSDHSDNNDAFTLEEVAPESSEEEEEEEDDEKEKVPVRKYGRGRPRKGEVRIKKKSIPKATKKNKSPRNLFFCKLGFPDWKARELGNEDVSTRLLPSPDKLAEDSVPRPSLASLHLPIWFTSVAIAHFIGMDIK